MSIWSGAAGAGWSNDGSWNSPPAATDSLTFPNGAQNLTNINDLAVVNKFGELRFTGANYNISGNQITLIGGLSALQNAGGDTLALPIVLTTTPFVNVLNQAASLNINAAVSGTDGLLKLGAGSLRLGANNDYTGTTTVDAGELTVDGSIVNSSVTVNAGGRLDGGGTVGPVTSLGGVLGGGTATTPATLTVNGDLSFNNSSVLDLTILSDQAGTGYGQLKVNGAVNLNDVALNPSLGFTPTGNETFTIIDNTGSSPTTGTFVGLPEGAILTLNGTEKFTVSYEGGTGNDVVLKHLVATTSTVQASTTTPVFGQTVTLTATVSNSGAGTPTGTVEFFLDGTTSLGTATLTNGSATLDVSTLPIGADSVTVKYLGDSGNFASTSEPITVSVSKANLTNIVSAQPSPSVFGQQVAITANLAAVAPGSGKPTGNVEFFFDTTSLGTATLQDGVATLTTSSLPLGSSILTAKYAGDSNFNGADSTGVNFAVGQSNTSVALTGVPNPSTLSQSVKFTATVQASTPGSGTPTGTVRFSSNGTVLGTASLDIAGVATFDTTQLSGGQNTITAQYLGDTNFAASTSPGFSQQVTQSTTTTALTAVPNTSIFGQSVLLTATITPAINGPVVPTGTVQFFNGNASLGTAAVSNGVATLSVTTLPVATNQITASYQGDVNYLSSTSSASPVTVSQASTTTAVTGNPSPSVVGQTVAFTATVTPVAPGGGTPTGSVEFFNGATSVGTANLAAGKATLNLSNLTLGTSSITAKYKGDNNNQASTSAAFSAVVNQAATSVTLVLSDTAPAAYRKVNFTATVKPTSGSGTVTGSVTFYANGLIMGAAPLINGAANLTTKLLPIGAGVVTAVYSGDVNNLTSTSAGTSVTVGKPFEQFLNQVYTLAMSRPVDLESMLYWENRFAKGASTGMIAAAVFNSTEAKWNAVRLNYQSYLHRNSTPAETTGGYNAESTGKFGSKPIVLGSSEYYKTEGKNTADGYIAALGQSIVGGPFTTSLQSKLKKSLQRGASLTSVATQALSALESKQALVKSAFTTILGRAATTRDVTAGVKFLNKSTLRDYNTMLISSQEFYDTYSNQTVTQD